MHIRGVYIVYLDLETRLKIQDLVGNMLAGAFNNRDRMEGLAVAFLHIKKRCCRLMYVPAYTVSTALCSKQIIDSSMKYTPLPNSNF